MTHDNPPPSASLATSVPLRPADAFVTEIEALMRRAEAEGQSMLAYLLETTLAEARRIADHQRRD